MPTFIMATRLSPEALRSPMSLERIQHNVQEQVKLNCAGVDWIETFAVLGTYDYIDIFDAPDIDTAMKVSTIIRTFGHAFTEIWPAKKWEAYRDMVRNLPSQEGGV